MNISLIFISGTPTSKIVGDKIDPYWFQNNGFHVEFWNLSEINYSQKKLARYFGGHPEYRYKFPNEKCFTTKTEVGEALSKCPKNTIFNYLDFGQTNDYWLRRYFTIYKCEYYVGARRTSEIQSTQSKSEYLTKKIVQLKDRKFITQYGKKLVSRIYTIFNDFLYKNTEFLKKPLFTVTSGRLGRIQWDKITQTKSILSVPSIDISWHKSNQIINDHYCVYIDDAVIYSPDKSMEDSLDASTAIDIKFFQENICKVFDEIERAKEIKVVVAASGKYQYESSAIFGNRDIFYHKTNELIQHSNLVLGHCSSGLMQAVVDMKPIILMLDRSFIPIKNEKVLRMGDFLGVEPIWSIGINSQYISSVVANFTRNEEIIRDYFCEEDVSGDYRIIIRKKIIQTYNLRGRASTC
jgi:hypothetical protein